MEGLSAYMRSVIQFPGINEDHFKGALERSTNILKEKDGSHNVSCDTLITC